MNGRKARQLRQSIRSNYANMPWESYAPDTEHYKLYFDFSEMKSVPMPVYTRMLGSCQKALYKMAKQAYKIHKRGGIYQRVI